MKPQNIQGVIEIEGKKFEASKVIATLIDQGYLVSFKDDALRIGQALLSSDSSLNTDNIPCPLTDICKKYEEFMSKKSEKSEKTTQSSGSSKSKLSPNKIRNSSKARNNIVYEDTISLNPHEMDYHDLDEDIEAEIERKMQEHYTDETDLLDPNPKKMIGVGAPTLAGPGPSQQKHIPERQKGTCPFCGRVVNIRWKYCGVCGEKIRR